MNKEKFPSNLSLEEREKLLLEMSDDKIDYSDIPALDDDFLQNAKLVQKKVTTEEIKMKIETEVLDWFRSQGKGYETLMNDVLKTYVIKQKTNINI